MVSGETEMKLEQKIQKEIIDAIHKLGGVAFNIISASVGGVPDIIACINGKFYGIEVKRPSRDAEPLQKFRIRQINKAGGVAFVAHSVKEVLDKVK